MCVFLKANQQQNIRCWTQCSSVTIGWYENRQGCTKNCIGAHLVTDWNFFGDFRLCSLRCWVCSSLSSTSTSAQKSSHKLLKGMSFIICFFCFFVFPFFFLLPAFKSTGKCNRCFFLLFCYKTLSLPYLSAVLMLQVSLARDVRRDCRFLYHATGAVPQPHACVRLFYLFFLLFYVLWWTLLKTWCCCC